MDTNLPPVVDTHCTRWEKIAQKILSSPFKKQIRVVLENNENCFVKPNFVRVKLSFVCLWDQLLLFDR